MHARLTLSNGVLRGSDFQRENRKFDALLQRARRQATLAPPRDCQPPESRAETVKMSIKPSIWRPDSLYIRL